jgi:hypothetical protein
MTNDTTHEALAASIAALNAFLDWRISIDMNYSRDVEEVRYAFYTKACEDHLRVTGREYMPVLWGAS